MYDRVTRKRTELILAQLSRFTRGLSYTTSMSFYVRLHGKITRQSQPLTQYNIQKQRIN